MPVVILSVKLIFYMKNLKNKKVKNATKVEIDSITFRSKLEAYTY